MSLRVDQFATYGHRKPFQNDGVSTASQPSEAEPSAPSARPSNEGRRVCSEISATPAIQEVAYEPTAGKWIPLNLHQTKAGLYVRAQLPAPVSQN